MAASDEEERCDPVGAEDVMFKIADFVVARTPQDQAADSMLATRVD